MPWTSGCPARAAPGEWSVRPTSSIGRPRRASVHRRRPDQCPRPLLSLAENAARPRNDLDAFGRGSPSSWREKTSSFTPGYEVVPLLAHLVSLAPHHTVSIVFQTPGDGGHPRSTKPIGRVVFAGDEVVELFPAPPMLLFAFPPRLYCSLSFGLRRKCAGSSTPKRSRSSSMSRMSFSVGTYPYA